MSGLFYTLQDSDAGESADSDRAVREGGGAEDLSEDKQRRREVVQLKQQHCGGRRLDRRERHGTDCALERRLLKYRVVDKDRMTTIESIFD